MPIYAIGDVQGCLNALRRLLQHINFDPAADRLWFVGDLVNRGPHSLEVLRFVKQLGPAAVTVLGNHDLHLLAAWCGITRLQPKDTLYPILEAPDAEDLLTWLRHRPLAHWEHEHLMIHAGVLPFWTLEETLRLASEVEDALQGQDFAQHLPSIYFRKPIHPLSPMSPQDRLSITTNVLTRMRVCTPDGLPEFSFKGPPDKAPPGYLPWFRIPDRETRHHKILFGHWSALGILTETHILALDGGCVWGRELAAIRLSDHQVFRVSCDSSL